MQQISLLQKRFGLCDFGATEAVGENEKFKKFIPLLALILGVVIGVICYYALPEVLSASSLAMAIVMGGASGLAATGGDQVVKQLMKGSANDSIGSNKEEENVVSLDNFENMLAESIADRVLKQIKSDESVTKEKIDG